MTALFVTHPVLDLVARHPAFLDAHGLGPAGIALLALLATLVPALVIAPLAWLLARHVRTPRPLRLWLTLLSPAALIVPLVFLADADVRSRIWSDPGVNVPRVAIEDPEPIVWVVFDELPLAVLLDEESDDDAIDASLFPHFAALTGEALWFRHAYSPYATTLPSVPAMLTGRYADDDRVVQSPECNVFRDLAASHRIVAREHLTHLAEGVRSGHTDLAALLSDLGILYLHRVVPDGWTSLRARIPRVDLGWSDFGRSPADEVARFERFVRELSFDGGPTFHYLHVALPHRPWRLGPDLAQGPERTDVSGLVDQVRAVDRLLGSLVQRLRDLGAWDRTVVIVVADHGLGFRGGAGERGDPDPAVVMGQILRVPLFLKLPGSEAPTGPIDRYVETVDLVPTLAERLGYAPSCPPDGRSLLAPERRLEETFIYARSGGRGQQSE